MSKTNIIALLCMLSGILLLVGLFVLQSDNMFLFIIGAILVYVGTHMAPASPEQLKKEEEDRKRLQKDSEEAYKKRREKADRIWRR